MSRLIVVLLLAAAITAAAAIAVSLISETGERTGRAMGRPGGRLNAVQRVAYMLLMAVTVGTAAGWLGAE